MKFVNFFFFFKFLKQKFTNNQQKFVIFDEFDNNFDENNVRI